RHAVCVSPSSTPSVITPRRTRLVRANDLYEFRRVISYVVSGFSGTSRTASQAIVVPTRAAASELARILPDNGRLLVTRDQLYDVLHSRLRTPPARLNAFEREAIAQ